MLEAGRVVLLQIPTPGAVEALQGPSVVAAIDAGSRFCELTIGVRGHGGNDRNAFGTVRLHTRAEFAASVDPMDEARAVLRRLRRIEALEREHAPARSVLAEVGALLVEAQAWASVERTGTDEVEEALARCRVALEAGATAPAEALSS